jgi:hypothetical protein
MAWVNYIQWRLGAAGGPLIPRTAGLYVIENPGNVVVYAGRANSLHTRFKNRSDSLEDLDVRSPTINGVSLYTCTVAHIGNMDTAERWLIRALYLRDQAMAPHTFQNLQFINGFHAPGDGLTINNIGTRPAFLNAQYVYAAGIAI